MSFRTGLSYSDYGVSGKRNIVYPGTSQVLSSSYGASTLQAFGEVSYAWKQGASTIEPYANLAHLRYKRNASTEKGGSAALQLSAEDMTTNFLTFGARTTAKLNDQMSVYGDLGWRRAFGDITPSSRASFAGSDAFTVTGLPIARNSAIIEAGFNYQASPTTVLSVGYAGQIANDTRNHTINASFSMKF